MRSVDSGLQPEARRSQQRDYRGFGDWLGVVGLESVRLIGSEASELFLSNRGHAPLGCLRFGAAFGSVNEAPAIFFPPFSGQNRIFPLLCDRKPENRY